MGYYDHATLMAYGLGPWAERASCTRTEQRRNEGVSRKSGTPIIRRRWGLLTWIGHFFATPSLKPSRHNS